MERCLCDEGDDRRSGRLASPLAIGRGCGGRGILARASDSRSHTPAARAAGEAAFLFLGGLWRGIHQAEHLVHRLARVRIALGEPALAIVRATLPVAAPVQALAWILGHAKIHDCFSPSRFIKPHQRQGATATRILICSKYTRRRQVSQDWHACCFATR